MRASALLTDPGPVILSGTGEAAVTALWRLSAAGAQIHWYADRTDLGEEIALAAALGGGRLELSFESPPTAPLEGVRRDDRDATAARAAPAARPIRDALVRLRAHVRRLRRPTSAAPEAA